MNVTSTLRESAGARQGRLGDQTHGRNAHGSLQIESLSWYFVGPLSDQNENRGPHRGGRNREIKEWNQESAQPSGDRGKILLPENAGVKEKNLGPVEEVSEIKQ
jgi:hypothetical protein